MKWQKATLSGAGSRSGCVDIMFIQRLRDAVVLVAQRFERRTFDQAVVGSTLGRDVIKAPRSTQPSIHPGR